MNTFLRLTSLAMLLVAVIAILVIAKGESSSHQRTSPANEELRDAAARAYESAKVGYEVVGYGPEDAYLWSYRWMDAERAISTTPQQELQAVHSHLQRMEKMSERSSRLDEWPRIAYYLTQAEILAASLDPKEKERYERIRLDRERLQGNWRVESESIGGEPLEKFLCEFEAFIVRGRIVEERRGAGAARGMLTIDPAASPKTFEYGGINEDFVFYGAGTYQLTGNVWTIHFTSHFGNGVQDRVLTLVRVKELPEEKMPVMVAPALEEPAMEEPDGIPEDEPIRNQIPARGPRNRFRADSSSAD